MRYVDGLVRKWEIVLGSEAATDAYKWSRLLDSTTEEGRLIRSEREIERGASVPQSGKKSSSRGILEVMSRRT